MKLSETFSSPESRVYAVVMFVDMTESTNMKEKEPEASWLTTYGWFFDKISDAVEAFGGKIVKYLGDGVMAVFDDEHAADAINAGISIQEEIALGNENRRVVCHCSIGIATGEVVRFETTQGEDYIGTVVDRSARLCGAASPKAVFADKATIATALMRKIKSRLGEAKAPRRTVDEYQGSVQKIPLKGLITPVEYHEIFWNQQLYGVKSSAVPSGPTNVPTVVHQPDNSGAEHLSGSVRRWDSEKGNGFFVTEGGEFFYSDTRYIAGRAESIKAGERVFFVAHPPLIEGRNRVAAGLVTLGEEMRGVVVRIHHTKKFGTVQVVDSAGNAHDIFLYIGDPNLAISRNASVIFRVSENDKGAVALLQSILSS